MEYSEQRSTERMQTNVGGNETIWRQSLEQAYGSESESKADDDCRKKKTRNQIPINHTVNMHTTPPFATRLHHQCKESYLFRWFGYKKIKWPKAGKAPKEEKIKPNSMVLTLTTEHTRTRMLANVQKQLENA